jgi:hypothetical protein
MIKLPEKLLRDEDEMRAFYLSVGISPEVTELAILARRQKPAGDQADAPKSQERARAPKGKKRKASGAEK